MNQTDPTHVTMSPEALAIELFTTGQSMTGGRLEAERLLTQIRERAAVSAVVSPPTSRAAGLERVRALHQPMERGPFTICAHCSGWDGKWRCLGVVTDYPCPTVRALDGELAVEAHGTGTQQQDGEAPRRQTVEYFVQSQQPDGTWECGSSFSTDSAFAAARLAARRRMMPDLTLRLAERTTTVNVRALPDCLTCRHWSCNGDGPCGALLDAWQRCTCTGPAPVAQQPAAADGEDCCGIEPPQDGTWGDCWCTLPPGHDGEHRCQPCTDRHGAPGWDAAP